jgi:hypothetical protein
MRAVIYHLKRWWLRRRIALIHYRREELKCIVRRENALLDWEEIAVNAQLRTLESDKMQRAADASLMQQR